MSLQIKQRYRIWKYMILFPWFERNRGHAFFKFFENATWFKWYGKRVVYVKSKPVEELTVTQADVKAALVSKDYTRALEIIEQLPINPQTTALKQVIQAKLV